MLAVVPTPNEVPTAKLLDVFAVENAPFHLRDAVPNCLALLVEGTKFVFALPLNCKISDVASPSVTPPLSVVAPSTFNVVSKSTAPVACKPPVFTFVAPTLAVATISPPADTFPVNVLNPATVNVPSVCTAVVDNDVLAVPC